jgi:tRNA modification GTPase
VLAGRVNVGKSSLLNALAGHQRSIVHHEPGTTRDAVTLATAIDGWPIELCDTAGLRASDNAVEQAGIERAQQRLAGADLVVLVSDQSQPWSAEDQALVDAWPASVLVHNKCDRPAGDCPDFCVSDIENGAVPFAAKTGLTRPAGLSTSALDGTGVEALLTLIAQRLVADPPPPGAAVPLTPEQLEAISRLGPR